MQTYSEMNEQIVEILRLRADRDPILLYTAQRIEKLEQQLVVIWGDDGPHESGAECISCERPAMQDTWPYCRICLLAGQLEVCDEGFGDAVKRIVELERQLQTERQARAEAEVSLQRVAGQFTDEQLAAGIRLAVERLREVMAQ